MDNALEASATVTKFQSLQVVFGKVEAGAACARIYLNQPRIAVSPRRGFIVSHVEGLDQAI